MGIAPRRGRTEALKGFGGMKGGDTMRPWGRWQWLWPKLPPREWHLVGCVATEDRSLGLWNWFVRNQRAANARMVWINDEIPFGDADLEAIKRQRLGVFFANGGASTQVSDVGLLARPSEFVSALGIEGSSGQTNVILDISSFPKRFFFFLVRELLSSSAVENLVVTYTVPSRYAATLAENPQPALALPGFVQDSYGTKIDVGVVGIGYDPLGLSELLSEFEVASIRLLLPFPSSQESYRRNLAAVAELRRNNRSGAIGEPDRLDPFDCSQCFDAIARMTQNGTLKSFLAPYGPKPMSLAMCLFSIASRAAHGKLVPVFYAQPRTYIPDYSAGISTVSNEKEIYGYILKWEGGSMYKLA